jgi:hypothetical protein
MRRGPKPAKPKVEAKPPVARKSRKDEGSRVHDLEKRLAETLGQLQSRDRELAEAREQLTAAHAQLSESHEQQTATSEILRVISQSPTDVQPAFDAIARNAVTLCGGTTALVLRFDGEMLGLAGHHAISPEGVERNQRAFPRRPGRDSPTGRAFLDRSVVHVPDIQAATEFVASTARQAGAGGSLLAVPLFREQEPIGVIGVTRSLVGPFSSQQIALLQTFADQAVIAIENVRRFNETKEALERQTATSEILRVISTSPADAQPVFDAIVQSGLQLCDGYLCVLTRFDGERLRLVALNAHPDFTSEGIAAFRRPFPVTTDEGGLLGRAIVERIPYHTADIINDPRAGPYGSSMARALGYRALVHMPMLHEETALGQ